MADRQDDGLNLIRRSWKTCVLHTHFEKQLLHTLVERKDESVIGVGRNPAELYDTKIEEK